MSAVKGELPQEMLPGTVWSDYRPLRGRWDEAMASDGRFRPQWTGPMQSLDVLPLGEMSQRWERGRRLIRENGITFNAYGDPEGVDRPWQLDPLPMIVSAEEWRRIEAAMVQRATLLNHVLVDLYGARRLLAEGILPPALAFAHPGYLRPLRHARPPDEVMLHIYAADIARAADGRWWVISDRCEAPVGVGYALENRVIVARTLSDILKNQPVQSLTPFLHKLDDAMLSLCGGARRIPRVVLLTPGPYTGTYFEHAFLARQLGYTLVQGEDLTTRDDRVFLKTLDGLQPVDVILRRTDGALCDPLVLRRDSRQGVAGLTQASRRSTVAVANALGSGVLEGGSLAAFLPVLSRHILGEDLKMPSVATWWCGGPRELDYVTNHIEELVIKAAFPRPDAIQSVIGETLSEARRAAMIEAIRRRPRDFLAQERISLSTAPVWSKQTIEPRPVMVRVFLVVHNGSYAVMPGGLTRVAAERGSAIVSMQFGGGSKDTWVLAEPRSHPPPVVRSNGQPVKLVRGTHDLPSRVADNLFSLGRHIERAEDASRLLRAALSRAGSAAGFGAANELPMVLKLLNRIYRCEAKGGPDEQVAALLALHMASDHVGGLRATIGGVHRLAALVRDRLSSDTWRAVGGLHQEWATLPAASRLNLEDALSTLNSVILATGALTGLAMENMARGMEWRFIDIGRRLERSLHLLDLLSGLLHQRQGRSGLGLDILLEVSDSAMTYRSRYQSSPQFGSVFDLLMADESNPRSLAFQLAALDGHANHLAGRRQSAFFATDQKVAMWLIGAVRTAEIERLAIPDEDGAHRSLATLLKQIHGKLLELADILTREYFAHTAGRGPDATNRQDSLP